MKGTPTNDLLRVTGSPGGPPLPSQIKRCVVNVSSPLVSPPSDNLEAAGGNCHLALLPLQAERAVSACNSSRPLILTCGFTGFSLRLSAARRPSF